MAGHENAHKPTARSTAADTKTDTARQGEQCPSSCPGLTLTGELDKHTSLRLRSTSADTETDTARQGEQCPSSCPGLTLTGELNTRKGPYCTIPESLFSLAFCNFFKLFCMRHANRKFYREKLSGACFQLWRLKRRNTWRDAAWRQPAARKKLI